MSRVLPDLASNGRLTMRQMMAPLDPQTVHRARLMVAAYARGKDDYLALVHALGMGPQRGEGMVEPRAWASTPES